MLSSIYEQICCFFMPFTANNFNVPAQFFDRENDRQPALFGIWTWGRQAGWGKNDLPG
jgi:hypothetical protein